MSFSLGGALSGGILGGALGGPFGAMFGGGFGGIGGFSGLFPQRPDAPQLPQAPTMQAPQFPNYPGFTPQEQALLQQQQAYLQQAGGLVGGFGQNPYNQLSSGGIANQELQNYQNALTGNIAPNQMIEQQKAKDWQQTVEQAGQQGIRLSGSAPENAVAQSTAGNQIIQDFNKRYGSLEQQYNLGQQQFGQQANMARLGMGLNQYGAQLGGYGSLLGMNQQVMNPYMQQSLGQFGVATNQAMSNADIANQNRMNAYQQAMAQVTGNYNNAMAGYQTNMGLLTGGLGLAGQIIGRSMGGGQGYGGMGGGGLGFMPYQPQGQGNYGYNPGYLTGANRMNLY